MSDSSSTFADRLREWLTVTLPELLDGRDVHGGTGRDHDVEIQKVVQASLYDAGFSGITWPKEYGGQGLGTEEWITFNTVSHDFDIPNGVFSVGLGMCAPTLLDCASDELKRKHVKNIARGDEIWCQLFSEPGAGSDVAALRTTAIRDGDQWVINGQKVWTSAAQFADYGLLLARTDPSRPKHGGLTMFALDMRSLGVTVRPLKVATGASPFNEVFFEDVHIPDSAVIGEVNAGWQVAVTTLQHERIFGGAQKRAGRNPLSADKIVEFAVQHNIELTPQRREALARLIAHDRAVSMFGHVIREEDRAGVGDGARGSIAKLAMAELTSHAVDTALDVLGDQVTTFEDAEADDVANGMLDVLSRAIAGGSNGIQRNIIAERLLGLPKDPGFDRMTPFNEIRTSR